jgi:D-alanine-D-alanine ligase-like ATP-grasp enzyme
MMIPDISAPMDTTAVLPVLEINSMPGFKMHYYPTAGGVPRNVAAALLDVTLGKAQE